MRKIIQISDNLVLCNDGSLWRLLVWDGQHYEWQRVPNVPQPDYSEKPKAVKTG